MADEALQAVFAVVHALERLHLDYLVGGSLASSLHGVPRSTQDADLVVDLPRERVADLIAALGSAFYVAEEAALSAVDRAAAFNVIHLETMFKVDLFILPDAPGARLEMSRRERHEIGEAGQALWFASAEDTVLQKLVWYRLGRRVSDRQWRDLVDVLRVQGARLERAYLARQAEELGLTELLDEALVEAGQEPTR